VERVDGGQLAPFDGHGVKREKEIKMDDKDKNPDASVPTTEPRRPYEPPRMTIHGTLAQITQGLQAGSSDPGGLTATGL